MEAQVSDHISEIVTLLQEYSPLFPKSSNFSFRVLNDTQDVRTMSGIQMLVEIVPPQIVIYTSGRFVVYWNKFSPSALLLMREMGLVKGDARFIERSCEYVVGDPKLFLEEFKQIFMWQKYSKEFDELLEEELSKKPE